MLETISTLNSENISDFYQSLENLSENEINIEQFERELSDMMNEYDSKLGGWELSRACGCLMRNEVIKINLQAKESKDPEIKDKLPEDVKKVETIVRVYHKKLGYEWNTVRNGFFAEAAAMLAFKELGFDVFLPDFQDDTKGKIDCWVTEQGEMDNPKIFAVQVKSSSNINKVILDRIDSNTISSQIESAWDLIKPGSVERMDILQKDILNESKEMSDYLSHSNPYAKIIPIVLIIPGGDTCEYPMYNTRSGAPFQGDLENKGLGYIMYGKLESFLFSREEKGD